jgi:Spy/CpxP family protein refolding chaperone
MSDEAMRHNPPRFLLLVLMTVGVLLSFSFATTARAQEQYPAQDETQTPDDPIESLRLTPEQRQRIRAINQENRAERIRVNRQLADAQAALEEVLDSDSPSEALVEQRIRDVSNAQTAHIRMRVSNELRIRSVLTPEQMKVWKEIRRANATKRRMNNPDGGRRNAPNQRNGIAPLYPDGRRNPRLPRP